MYIAKKLANYAANGKPSSNSLATDVYTDSAMFTGPISCPEPLSAPWPKNRGPMVVVKAAEPESPLNEKCSGCPS